MTETEAIQLFKCLSDKSRLQILKSLAIEDMYVERLAERLGITAPTVSFHLKKLSRENLSDLSPDPLLVKLEYSHPTLSQRIAAIEKIK